LNRWYYSGVLCNLKVHHCHYVSLPEPYPISAEFISHL
jgi:hypothetical protein